MDRFRKNFSDCFSIAVIAFVAIGFLIMKDTGTTAALCWLAVVFSISFFMRPYMPFGNLKFPDGGFALTFGGGLFICFYTSWVIASTNLAEYSDPVMHIVFVLYALAGFAVRKYICKKEYVSRAGISQYLRGFAIFAVIFLVVFWVIGFNPVVDPGTENYMDFGFLQMIYRQKRAVPLDIWFSKENLNYYYLGQSATVYMCRLSHTTPEYGYNMMLATFTATVFVAVFELVAGIAGSLFTDEKKNRIGAAAGGIIGGLTAAFGANTHWLFYGVLKPLSDKITGKDRDSYWFPDGTVYIRTDLGDADNGKNEFPAYSAILGDLHAHVVNLIFVLPLIAILFDMCLSDDEKDRKASIYKLILISALLGFFKGANYWDFAVYFVITGAVIVFTDIHKKGLSLQTLAHIAVKAAIVTTFSLVVILPFTLNFIRMESGVKICDNHTAFVKLAVLWLIPVIISTGLLAFMYMKRSDGVIKRGSCRAALCALIPCTFGLVLVPELVYVADIYGADNKRFNTMFKLTYEAFVLFALIMGIAFASCLVSFLSDKKRSKIAAACGIGIAAVATISVSYSPYAVKQWFGNVFHAQERKGISSLDGLRDDAVYGFEMEAYDVIAADDGKIVNIIEGAGDSYTHNCALSVYTGACTPAGWFVHEWMWHNDAEPIRRRSDDVSSFYQSGNEELCKTLLRYYDVDYIFVGPAEVCRYAVDYRGFVNLGQPVISTEWQGCHLMLIKVDRSKL
ncbi:MAG: hypothetical protein K6F87_01570 [Lachnospiraceae bacterium]|nr:hypothetical protein [Lachnospiraceae bacterium]